MRRVKLILVLLLGLALAGVAGYFAFADRAQSRAEAAQLDGLAWLPADSGLVAGIDLAGLREQQWLLDLLRSASGDVTEAPDYRAFVDATGFDYTRDLERVWLGLTGSGDNAQLAAIAQGRFHRDRILAFAQQEGATATKYQGLEIFHVQPPPRPAAREPKPFAFVFLDDTHLALASTPERAGQIVDCWLGQAQAIGSDTLRVAELERLAAGRQVWALDNTAVFTPPGLPPAGSGQPLSSVVEQLTFGLRASPEGLELSGEARCHEPAQAERLRDNVFILVQLGRLAFARNQDETSKAVHDVLDRVSIDQRGPSVEARVLVPPHAVETLLHPPATGGAPGR